MKKKTLKFLLKLSVSIVFVLWIIFTVDWEESLEYLRKIELIHIVFYILFLFVGITISAYKWKKLANFKGVNLDFRDAFQLYFTGTFINNFMPSFIGGDTFKAYEVGKRDGKYFQSTSSIVADRFTGLLGSMILALIFGFINFQAISETSLLLPINLAVLALLLVSLIFLKIRKHFYSNKFFKFIPEKVRNFTQELDQYNNNSKIFWTAIFYSGLFSLIGVALANYFIFLGLGVEISPIDYLSVIFLISIVASIPVSINNIGIKEWAYITFFGFFGVSSSAVVVVAILSRLLQMLLSFFALPMYLKSRNNRGR